MPTICGMCHRPEVLLADSGRPRQLIAYADAVTQVVRFVCAECERIIVAANHSIRKLAEGIMFLSGGGSVPVVVDVAAT
jgi:hypothetical protein